MTDMSNHLKPVGLKHTELLFHNSTGQKSDVGLTGLKSSFGRAVFLSAGSRGGSVSFSQRLAAARIPWLVALSIFEARVD